MKFNRNRKNVVREFSRKDLARICAMDETDFADAYDMTTTYIEEVRTSENFYHFLDRGSKVLAVAHLDTVVASDKRTAHFMDTAAGPVVYSGALDDRLGAYIILELLPRLGLDYDVLLTVGEESGQSTAEYFDAPDGKDYDWIIEFDRGGTDVVMYQYDDKQMRDLVRATGAIVSDGIFSDISYMEHLGIKAFNWGVGYRDYHGPRSHAYLNDTFDMVARYLKFHQQNEGVYMQHDEDFGYSRYGKSPKVPGSSWERGVPASSFWWDDPSANNDADEDVYAEAEYFDREYVEDPTLEEIQRHLVEMDEERYALLDKVHDCDGDCHPGNCEFSHADHFGYRDADQQVG